MLYTERATSDGGLVVANAACIVLRMAPLYLVSYCWARLCPRKTTAVKYPISCKQALWWFISVSRWVVFPAVAFVDLFSKLFQCQEKSWNLTILWIGGEKLLLGARSMLCEWIDHFHVQMWSYIVSAFPMGRFCAVIGQFRIRLRSIHKLIQKQTNLSSAMQCSLAGTAVGYRYNWTLFGEWLEIKVGKNHGSKLVYQHVLSFLSHLYCWIIKPQGLTKSSFYMWWCEL